MAARLMPALAAHNKLELKMEKKKNTKSDLEFLLEKMWQAYNVIDDRRRKAFNQLFSVMAIVILLWIAPAEKFQPQFIGTELNKFLILSIAPFFLSFLLIKYLYLSGNAFIYYIDYLRLYEKSHKKELDEIGFDFKKLYKGIKIRDFSDSFNLFSFPRHFRKPDDFGFGIIWNLVDSWGHNFTTLLTYLIPFTAYLAIMVWFAKNYSTHITKFQGITILIFLTLNGLFIKTTLVWLYRRTKEARSFFMQKFNS